jgi:hypothetical protein
LGFGNGGRKETLIFVISELISYCFDDSNIKQTHHILRVFLGFLFILLVLNGSSVTFLDAVGFGEKGSHFDTHQSISNYFVAYQNISSGGTL